MTLSTVPKANAMLICDYVITERTTNKKSLIGVFENIGAPKFPCTHYALSVYIKLTEAQGTFQFRLELIDLKTNTMIGKSETPDNVNIQNPLIAHELVFNLKGLRFLHPGEYEFRIFANDRIFGQKTFAMNQIEQKK